MADVWILVTDSAQAQLYSARDLRSDPELVDTLTHGASRLHPRELGSDVPGRVHDRFGPGRHSLDEGQQLKKTERDRFAREIAAHLAAGLAARRFDRLVIMAPPQFLGVLRPCLGKPVAEALIAEVAKDLVAHDIADIRAHLPQA